VATQAERRATTRTKLIDSAVCLFGEHGYQAVTLAVVASDANVTKGALYHHFEDKSLLFEAAYDAVETRMVEQIASVVDVGQVAADPIETLFDGFAAFLEHCTRDPFRQIAMIDAPSVLGWKRWREIDAEHGLGLIIAALDAAMSSARIEARPVQPLAHMVLAVLMEAGLLMANAEPADRAAISDESQRIIRRAL